MEREDTPLRPVEALREALANAFVHRDYSVRRLARIGPDKGGHWQLIE
jgi:predicted HTH transcriptional regulator